MSTLQDQAKKWMSVRLAVGAALIIGTGIFYLCYWFTMLRKQSKRPYIYMNEIASKYYLFGLGALISLNYAQAGIFQAVMIYIVLVMFLALIGSALLVDTIDDRKRTLIYSAYYFVLFAWYLGIIIDFYVTYN